MEHMTEKDKSLCILLYPVFLQLSCGEGGKPACKLESELPFDGWEGYLNSSCVLESPDLLHVPIQMPNVGSEQIGKATKGLPLAR